jgi:hypothetical protein
MSTLAKHSHHNRRLVEFCLPIAYPDGKITIERLIDDNLITGSQVAELAICRMSEILKIDSVGIGCDLSDGSDVKTTTVSEYCKFDKESGNVVSSRYQCKVHDIGNKTGTLRIITFNPFSNLWKFFIVPNSEFAGKKSIYIGFDKETGETIGKWSTFEVGDWKELSKI